MDKFAAGLLLGGFVFALAIIAMCMLHIKKQSKVIECKIGQDGILMRFFTLLEWKMGVSAKLPSPAKTDAQLERLRDILDKVNTDCDCIIATLANGDCRLAVNWEGVDDLVARMELRRNEYESVTRVRQPETVAS